MSVSYQAKDSLVLARQLKVQKLSIPFFITTNATPASKVLSVDEPALLFLAVEGIDQITPALDTGDTAPTLATATDTTGIFSVMVKINEVLSKVVSAKITRRNGQEVISLTLPSAPTTGIIAGTNQNKIVLNADSAVNFATTSYDACLEVEYVVAE